VVADRPTRIPGDHGAGWIHDDRLEYAMAGHEQILHYRATEGRVHRLRQQQMPLGLMADQTYEAASVPVGPGDVLAMYTDGLNETENSSGEQLGHDAIERTLTRTAGGSLPEAREAILDVARRHGPQTDDQTVLLVRIKGGSSTAQPAFAADAAGEGSHRRG
jgi:serine phosphatase RsbU (regulator of sigma subunit)